MLWISSISLFVIIFSNILPVQESRLIGLKSAGEEGAVHFGIGLITARFQQVGIVPVDQLMFINLVNIIMAFLW